MRISSLGIALVAAPGVPSGAQAHGEGMSPAAALGPLRPATAAFEMPLETQARATAAFEGPVPKVRRCVGDALPETGLQGQVPRSDRDRGRSKQGYRCNLELIGGLQGQGTFVGADQLKVTCQDNGLVTLRYTAGRFPLGTNATTGVELPTTSTCANRRDFVIRLHKGTSRLRCLRIQVNGRPARVSRSRAGIGLHGLPAGSARIKVIATLRGGRRVVAQRTYGTCAP